MKDLCRILSCGCYDKTLGGEASLDMSGKAWACSTMITKDGNIICTDS